MRFVHLTLLLIFCLKTCPGLCCSYVQISFREQIRNAKLAVLGAVVSVRGEVGERIGSFKVEEVLKGSTPLSEIELPFKETVTGPCDGTISYQAGERFLLLFSEFNGTLSKFPEKFPPTEGQTALNVIPFNPQDPDLVSKSTGV